MAETIVVDTNVLVSALIGSDGASREVLRKCLTGEYNPLISNALFAEYEDVISRDRVKNICPLSDKETRELVNALYGRCKWVPIYFLWRPNLQDEGDNFLVELAIAGNAEKIVTYNVEDLVDAELNFSGLRIVKPEHIAR